jgi:hypothetical protein
MTAADFRQMALAFAGVVEGSHMGHADFRVDGKRIFCTLNGEETRGMVSLTPDQQKSFMAGHPDMFMPASGAWGLQGSTMVELSAAEPEVVGEALTCAWQRVRVAIAASGTKRVTKSRSKRRLKSATTQATKRAANSTTKSGAKSPARTRKAAKKRRR